MAIEGGERGPNGSPNIFLAIEYSAMATRNRSRRGGEDELGGLVGEQERAVHQVRELEPRRRVPGMG